MITKSVLNAAEVEENADEFIGRLGRDPRLLPVAVGAGMALAAASMAVGTLVYAYAATHPIRRPIRCTPADLGLPYETVRFPAADGLILTGWLIPAPAASKRQGTIIVCHGYPQNRSEMLSYAALLHREGFAALLFDFRALGESEGDLCSVGYHEVEDLHGAVHYLAERPDTAESPIGALGLSLGGAVAIMGAARNERIRAVVAEAAYPTLQAALDARCRAFCGPWGPVLSPSIRAWARRWFPVEPSEVAPIEEIAAIAPRAVLIVQGRRDPLVRWQDACSMYERAGEPRDIWLLERSGHAACLQDEPEEYARRVSAFFCEHLGEDRG